MRDPLPLALDPLREPLARYLVGQNPRPQRNDERPEHYIGPLYFGRTWAAALADFPPTRFPMPLYTRPVRMNVSTPAPKPSNLAGRTVAASAIVGL